MNDTDNSLLCNNTEVQWRTGEHPFFFIFNIVCLLAAFCLAWVIHIHNRSIEDVHRNINTFLHMYVVDISLVLLLVTVLTL